MQVLEKSKERRKEGKRVLREKGVKEIDEKE